MVENESQKVGRFTGSSVGACIYCGGPDDGKEHWLPRSLGAIKGAGTLLDRLCNGCNNALGKVDEELARTGTTGWLRAVHGIEGRSGPSQVSPFSYRAMSAEQPTVLKMPDPTGVHQVLGEAVPDAERGHVAQQIRQLVFRRADSSRECVPFPRAWTSEQVKRAVQERHLEEAELIEVYLDVDEIPESENMRGVLREVFGKVEVPCWYGENEPGSVGRVEIAAGITPNYLRAVAKVAFHYFLWVSNLCRGDEREFAAVRDFIRNGVGDGRAFVQIRNEPVIPQFRTHVPTQVSHS